MRAFIVMCVVAAVCADQLGYNYQPVGHSDAGLSFAPGAGGHSVGGGHSGGGGHSHGSDQLSPSISAPAEFQKEFYTYSAPEGEFDDADGSQQASNSLKRGLRVIFIKGPENHGLENAALQLAKSASEDKTAIYVLNKQADIGDLANKLNSIRNQNSNRPEVHFVKYRTPEDAANAQHQIQSQYDGLGGSSQSHNGGVAPVLNFASQAPARPAAAPQSPGSTYLPASLFRRRF